MKKINKTAAKKIFGKQDFIIVACNLRPEYGIRIRKEWGRQDFEKMYNNFCYYNCNNEAGRYPAFYIEE